VLAVPIGINAKLGRLSIPMLAVVEFDPFPQLEPPAVRLQLLPAFHWAERDDLEAGAVDPGERVNSQLLAYHMVDVTATEVVVDVQGSWLVGGD
jgi:hypothetical protein